MEKLGFKTYLKKRIQSDKIFVCISLIYILLLLGTSIYFIATLQIRNFLMSFCFIFFVPLILVVEKWLKIEIVPLLVFLIYFLAYGSILGTAFDVYNKIPFFDSLLHGISGVIFACVGYTIMELFIGKANGWKQRMGCLVFGVCFSLAIAVLWELFEYAGTVLLGYDMQEDTCIYGFKSYYLSNSHNEIFDVHHITKTIIYYGDNQILELNGYLDIGLIDTIMDMFVCFLFNLLFVILMIIVRFVHHRISKFILPKIREI